MGGGRNRERPGRCEPDTRMIRHTQEEVGKGYKSKKYKPEMSYCRPVMATKANGVRGTRSGEMSAH